MKTPPTSRSSEEEPPNKKQRSLASSEKKRLREKTRRSEMNDSLDALAELVYKIEPSLISGKSNALRDGLTNIFNRSDLLQCSAQLLGRLHKENEERKVIIEDLKQKKSSGQLATTRPVPLRFSRAASLRYKIPIGIGGGMGGPSVAMLSEGGDDGDQQAMLPLLQELELRSLGLGRSVLQTNEGILQNVTLSPAAIAWALEGRRLHGQNR